MNILVIAPHPDDEVLGVGGTIAKHKANGDNVYICIVTKGMAPMFNEESVKQVRNEAIEAHKLLEVENTFFLDFPAVLLEEVPKYKLNAAIIKVLESTKPDIVYLPHRGDIHLDHKIVFDASMVALRPIGGSKVKEIYCYETLSETEWDAPNTTNAFIPNTWVDITQFIDIKKSAMSVFKSQVYSFPHPRSLQSLENLSKYRGANMGLNNAEAFMTIRRLV
ncbi:PIG-L deacetylase family protein [Ornithinibacillus halophilus]|uniref:N-acetylglucosaminyl deacetylase, LmbE family n=1 Tax=Ornithinibacillus halophilus TaxID=930117 RepID=A0A1M5GHU3_9BACI|nr:PIG-L deacetylase family protein [Ornithinibacillus halophilus]SHG03268.1 N-acetylglucosaminyl deacetylase, LmbE family [Ornithinibacillus halophilus]